MSQAYVNKVRDHFNGDVQKALDWWGKNNPSLDFNSPLNLIRHGQQRKVEKHIDNAIKKGLTL